MIRTHEEHGELVSTWHDLGYSHETVVCFDRHLDLKPLSGEQHSLLQAAATREELAGQNRKLPMRGVQGTYGLDDFYAAGASRGYVASLHWVMASDGPANLAGRKAALEQVAPLRAPRDILNTTAFTAAGALTTYTCGLALTVHTPSSFSMSDISPTARVDIDLDWFADVGPGPTHNPQELIDLLDPKLLSKHVDSVTYSVRSGFLPPSKRHLADDLARLLNRDIHAMVRADAPMPETAFDAIRRGVEASSDEISQLGATGLALSGLAAASRGRFEEAQTLWFLADEGGHSSVWLAYLIGISEFREKNYLSARIWFARATGNGNDPLEVHARLLVAVCDLRLGRTDLGLDGLRDLAWDYPLHQRANQLLIEISQRLDVPVPDDFMHQNETLLSLSGGIT